MNSDAGTDPKPTVPALIRGFAILDLLAKEPGLTFTDIYTRLRLPKSSTFHLVATLCRLGMLQSQSGGRYVLGLRLFELGAAATRQRHIEREAQPYLRALAQSEQLTCHLGVLEGHEAVYLSKVECEQDIRINTWVGKRLCLNRSALGKVLLAWLPEPEMGEIMARIDWDRKTPNTLTDAAALKAHLASVRAMGWASDNEEDVLNVRCVATPVADDRGRIVAAISAVGTVLQIGEERFPILANRLHETARKISEAVYPREPKRK